MAEFNNNDINSPEESLPAPEEKKGKEKSGKLEFLDWYQCLLLALVGGLLCFIFLARVITVDGSSMYPTLNHGDKVLTTGLFYQPEVGDIIVFQTDVHGPQPLVKRVIAVEGQTVDIDFERGIVYVDGVALDEPYTNSPTNDRESFTGPVTVPEGCLFVMGDNRNASTDSRSSSVGMVDERCIIGKVHIIALPGKDVLSGELNWSRLGSVY